MVLRKMMAGLSALALVATLGCWATWTGINKAEEGITVDPGLAGLLATPTASPTEGQDFTASTILIVGSDTRTGQEASYGTAADASGNGHSDTALLLHISANRRSAFAVSIPRDSWVTRPGCRADGTTDGSMAAPGKFNTAFAVGGRGCIIAAVKHLTGVPIDHFVEVDFRGFKALVDALGGVTICSTRAISDPVRPDGHGGFKGSGLELPKGESTLDGKQALELVRARYIDGGSDLERLQRQHAFVGAVIRQTTSAGLLANPVRLLDVLTQAAQSLTVDPGLAGDRLKTFLLSLEGLKPADVRFYTVPVVPRGDGANVVWVDKDARKMWTAMIHDTAYPPQTTVTATATPKPSAPGSTASPKPSASAATGSAADATCIS